MFSSFLFFSPRFSTRSFSLSGKKTWTEGFDVVQQTVDGSGEVSKLENYAGRAATESVEVTLFV